jgi:uncharacterized protein YcbX
MENFKTGLSAQIVQNNYMFSTFTTFCPNVRSFMAYNENNNFLFGRINPTMVLIKISVSDDKVELTAPNCESITFPIPSQSDTEKQVKVRYAFFCIMHNTFIKSENNSYFFLLYRIFGEEVAAFDCGDQVAQWLSQYLFQKDTGARLVHLSYPEVSPRVMKSKPAYPWMKPTDAVINYTNRFLVITQSVNWLH